MTEAERGLMLLCCRLGDEEIKPLTLTQFYLLRMRFGDPCCPDAGRDLTAKDLISGGVSEPMASRVMRLLDRLPQLEAYLSRAERCGVSVVTRVSASYPDRLEARLQKSAPPVLFCRGDTTLLRLPCVALVGSRRIGASQRAFARKVGLLAAQEGYCLTSGGAYGADETALEACRGSGGKTVVFTPECLKEQKPLSGTLFCSEEGFEEPFSAARALARNRLIHALADVTLVAQSSLERGGTWRGSADNLKHGWSPLFVFDDGSEAAKALIDRGATGVKEISSLRDLSPDQFRLDV